MTMPEIVVEPGKLEIIVTMTFNAPRELVFKAYIDPALIPQWWGPRYLTTEFDRLDARTGGEWRFVQRDPDDNVYAFRGVFHIGPNRLFPLELWGTLADVRVQAFLGV